MKQTLQEYVEGRLALGSLILGCGGVLLVIYLIYLGVLWAIENWILLLIILGVVVACFITILLIIHSKPKATKDQEKAQRNKKIFLKIVSVAVAISLVIGILYILFISVIQPPMLYDKALSLMGSQKYSEALGIFLGIDNYKDSKTHIDTIWDQIAERKTIAAGMNHTVALKNDGTVVATGSNDAGQCNVTGWNDIIAIAAGNLHTVGLRSDGTVVAVGYNPNGHTSMYDHIQAS